MSYHKSTDVRLMTILYGDEPNLRFQVKIADGFSGPSFEMEIPVKDAWDLGNKAERRVQGFLDQNGVDLIRQALAGVGEDLLRDGREEFRKRLREKAEREAEEHMEGFGE